MVYKKSFSGDDIVTLMCRINDCIHDNDDLRVSNIYIQENIINSDDVYRYLIEIEFNEVIK